METVVEVGNRYVWGFPEALPWLVVVLLGSGFFITARLLFLQLRKVGHAVMVVLGKYDDPGDPGDVTHFQALSTALSATVGIGNIAGVATAIHYGGPGALFWMWVTAFFGMGLKFAECTLAVQYRGFDERGEVAGGPMYYIEKGLGRSWKPLAVFFAFCAVIASFGGGNMNQANTVTVSATSEFSVAPWMVGLALSAIVGVVILGGIRSIARVSSTLAPSMAAIYVLGALGVLIFNASEVPGAFVTIVSSAFTPEASLGGSVAGTFSLTLLWGVKRGLFSNEAGQGSAPIAHAAAKTDEPVREGLVAMLEPLIDTLIICTMTGLVIVSTGVWDRKLDDTMSFASANPALVSPSEQSVTVKVVDGLQDQVGFSANDGSVDDARLIAPGGAPFAGEIRYDAAQKSWGTFSVTGEAIAVTVAGRTLRNSSALTAWAFKEGLSPLGDWGNFIVTVCVFLFAISTMISWSYYGDRCITYLFGVKWVIVYRLVYIGFVYVGATTALDIVWAYGDLALGLMTLPNLLAIALLSPRLAKLTRDYFARMKEQHG